MTQALPLRLSDPPRFDLAGPLPTGVTLLEASAGTGKTFTIAALTARYVAAGVPLEHLLVVTFTRMATGELRERVRDRLVSAAEVLDSVMRGNAPPSDDELLEVLANGADGEVQRRLDLLAKAVGEFDAATIDTTHGFCLQVLSGLGVAGDVEVGTPLVENVEDLLDEVVDDLYVRRFVGHTERRPFRRSEARRIAAHALANPGARVLPELSDDRTDAAMRRRLVKAVEEEIDARKRAAGILTYDDLLTRLRDTLAHPVRGKAACTRLRERYRVVLVDEFQDTDPVQWEILRRAFAEGGSTLVLIGDPKQAIYAFRGADVFAYLEAADSAGAESTLRVNWRSDQQLLDAFDTLFDGCQLGHEGIVHRTVEAAPQHRLPRLVGANHEAPLHFRVLDRTTIEQTSRGYASAPAARLAIAGDVACEIAALLAAGAETVRRDADGAERSRERLSPSDLAVLVRTNLQARTVRDALAVAGIPAVLGGGGSVFATPPAQDWLRLLEALERPTARDRAAAAALTTFLGWTAEEVAGAGDDAWEDFHWQLHRWATLLQRRGVAALYESVTAAQQVPGRVLARRGGERFLTDLRHVGQLLHGASTADGLGPASLLAWLRRRIAEADRDSDDVDRSLRLESDAEAVQVLTVHRSKGLEFPVVYCPFLWDTINFENALPVFHDAAHGHARTIDVAGEGAEFEHHKLLHRDEERGEDLRLFYVALTRARHQVVVWWAGGYASGASPLGRLLFARQPGGLIAPDSGRTPSDQAVVQRLAELVDRSGGTISVDVFRAGGRRTGAGPSGPADTGVEGVGRDQGGDQGASEAPEEPGRSGGGAGGEAGAGGGSGDEPVLEAGVFERVLDSTWRRSSFSSITARSHVPAVGSEPEETALSDEAPASMPAAAAGAGAGPGGEGGAGTTDRPLLLGEMPGGVRIGTLVHSLFEELDFAGAELPQALREGLAVGEARSGVLVGDLGTVADGLLAAIETPLGPVGGGVRLRDLARADRVDEMNFELPLVGGDRATTELSVRDIGDVLRAHLPDGDPVAPYADRLADPTLEVGLRGYLTGSLDLVMRLPGPRFVVADYKTNRLAGEDELLTAWHYRPAALEAEMMRSHYPLQAILYTVSLHRYLRWRLPGYDAATHLGGVLYLFLRGMSGPRASPATSPPGVWSWQPPPALVEALSDLFDRGAPA
jgi:exodeoxyribonuclease V beta subunit